MRKAEKTRPTAGAFLGTALLAILLIAAACAGIAFGHIWPKAEGKTVKSGGSLKMDVSHMDEGYVMVRGPSSGKRLKMRVRLGDETAIYDINGNEEYEIIPLQFGSGDYTFSLYKNTSGNRYSDTGSVRLTVKLLDEDIAFICPNQFIQYTEDSEAVQKSEELCASCATDREKFDAICRFIESQFVYDYVQAVITAPGTRPDIDRCFQRRMGICQDLAALTVCMLRVQGIPSKMIVGYANEEYHAWVTAKIDGGEVFYDPTARLMSTSRKIVYTAEKFY